MADLNFPLNPQVGDTYSIGNRTWVWNGSGWQLQSGIISTNPFIVVSAQITTATNSTSTNSGALIVEGGGGFGGNVYAADVYSNGAQVITTGTIGNFGISMVQAGTDTSVAILMGNVALVWNTSTLQTVTGRGATTTNAISITNTTDSTNTTNGALTVSGGVGVGASLVVGNSVSIGLNKENYARITGATTSNSVTLETLGSDASVNLNISAKNNGVTKVTSTLASATTANNALYVQGGLGVEGPAYINNVYDNSRRVLTRVYPTAGTAISISNVSTTNDVTSFTINNEGVSTLNGSTYIGVSAVVGDITITNLGVQTLTAGTDTAVSQSTGTVTVWNKSTLQSVTDRGSTTTQAINITNTTSSTNTATGALTVAGGVGIGGDLWVAGQIVADKLTIQYTTITTTIVQTDDIIKTSNETVSTGTTTGALVVAGGAGIGGKVWTEQIRQTSSEVAIGSQAGEVDQGESAIAIGDSAGISTQSSYAISIGFEAGKELQGESAIAIGESAGNNTQGDAAIAIGALSGSTMQGGEAIAIGISAATNSQGNSSIAIGRSAGVETQGISSIAIGVNAGQERQGEFAVAIGYEAGGDYAGLTENYNQSPYAVAIGNFAGRAFQGVEAIALGNYAGNDTQGFYAVAIGAGAGKTNQGIAAIAIGNLAGETNQPDFSIIINATSETLDGTNSGLYIAPIRTDASNAATQWTLYYNPSTKEITTATRFNGGTITEQLIIANQTDSAGTASGALQVYGGAGIGGNVNIGGDLFVQGVINATVVGSISTATHLAGGVLGAIPYQTAFGRTSFINPDIAGKILTSQGAGAVPTYQNTLTLAGTTEAVSTDSGAFQVKGGAGVGGNLYVGGNLNVDGDIYMRGVGLNTITGSTATFDYLILEGTGTVLTASGDARFTGGITATLLTVNGPAVVSDLTATNTTVTSLTVHGAANIETSVGIGSALSVGNGISVTGTAVITSTANIGGDVGIGGNVGIAGNLFTTGTNVTIGASYFDSNAGIKGNLFVTGTSVLVGSVYTDGNVGIKGNAFTTGTSVVIGNSYVDSNLGVKGNFNVTGTTTISGLVSGNSAVLSGTLGVTGTTTLSGSVTIGPVSQHLSFQSPSTSTTATMSLDSFTATVYRSAKYFVQVVDSGVTPNKVQVAELVVFHDNNGESTIPYIIQYGIGHNTGELGAWNAVYSGGAIELQFTPNYTPTNLTVKTVRTSITT